MCSSLNGFRKDFLQCCQRSGCIILPMANNLTYQSRFSSINNSPVTLTSTKLECQSKNCCEFKCLNVRKSKLKGYRNTYNQKKKTT